MSTQIAVRLEPDELAALDAEVAAGRARSRSDAVRKSITYLDRHQAYRQETEILKSFAVSGEPLYPDLVNFQMPIIWDSE